MAAANDQSSMVTEHSASSTESSTAHAASNDAPRPKASGSSPPPIARGSSTAIAASESARGSSTTIEATPAAPPPAAKVEPAKPPIDPELAARAATIGEIWATECVRDLRAQHREIVGGWPGTLREARRRVLAAMPRNLDPLLLEDLAKLTNLAARRGWESVSEPDLEP